MINSIKLKKHNLGLKSQIQLLLLLPFVENSFKHGNNKFSFRLNTRFRELKSKYLLAVISNNYTLLQTKENGIRITDIEKKLSLIFSNKFHLKIKKAIC